MPGATLVEGMTELRLVEEPVSEHALVVHYGGQSVHVTLCSSLAIDAVLPALGALFGTSSALVPTVAGEVVPGAVSVGDVRRKPLVLVDP